MSFGFVYLARNASMPGLYKIGATRRSPSSRMDELSSATGVPCKFELAAYMECEDCFSYEKQFHAEYSFCRESECREFFRLSAIELHDFFIFFKNFGVSHWVNPLDFTLCGIEARGEMGVSNG